MGRPHLRLSRLLFGSLVAAVAATGALIVTMHVGLLSPPSQLTSVVVFPVVTGLFVLAWLVVVVVFSRDQILRRIEQLRVGPGSDGSQFDQLIAELRAQLAADRERELHLLEGRIAELTTEYGEQRETDGYLNGMRVATGAESAGAQIHPIRRTPPQR